MSYLRFHKLFKMFWKLHLTFNLDDIYTYKAPHSAILRATQQEVGLMWIKTDSMNCPFVLRKHQILAEKQVTKTKVIIIEW